MKAKKYWILSVLVAVIFAVASWAGFEHQRSSLTGLKGVFVQVYVPEEAEKCGLTTEVLQTDTELRLRRNGVRVLDEVPVPSAFLRVSVRARISSEPQIKVCGVELNVSFVQSVTLARDPSIHCLATTWTESGTGVSTKDNLKKDVRDGLKDPVDVFCNDYLAANPKEQPTKSKNN